jgi:hypothetical protein
MSVATIAHHITGVTCLELPLRGESLAAWLKSCFIQRAFGSKPLMLPDYASTDLSKYRKQLVPK